MKKKIIFYKKKNLKFFYSLINSDFLILEKFNYKKNSRFFKSNLKLFNNKKEFFSLLNYFELIKTLKQFIRILQFFKNTKVPTLFLDFKNKQFLKITDLYIKKNKTILPVEFKNNIFFKKNLSSFILFLDSTSFINNKNTLKKLIYSNIFIISKINSFVETDNSSFYKIFNNFDTLKKLIFLMILFKKFYNNKNRVK
jgi:hypothetical protein